MCEFCTFKIRQSKPTKRKSRKTLGNNDLNQVVASSGFSENKGLGGGSVSRAHKTWSRSFLFKDFRKSRSRGKHFDV